MSILFTGPILMLTTKIKSDNNKTPGVFRFLNLKVPDSFSKLYQNHVNKTDAQVSFDCKTSKGSIIFLVARKHLTILLTSRSKKFEVQRCASHFLRICAMLLAILLSPICRFAKYHRQNQCFPKWSYKLLVLQSCAYP